MAELRPFQIRQPDIAQPFQQVANLQNVLGQARLMQAKIAAAEAETAKQAQVKKFLLRGDADALVRHDPKLAKQIFDAQKSVGDRDVSNLNRNIQRYKNKGQGIPQEFYNDPSMQSLFGDSIGNIKAIEDLEAVYAGLTIKPTQKKIIERTIDLGDRVEYIYTDGSREDVEKGVAPKSAKQSGGFTLGKNQTRYDANGNEVATTVGKVEKEGKEFAPDHVQFRNAKTGKTRNVNLRNPQEVELAKEAGYEPIGPKARGYLGEEGKIMAKEAADFRERASTSRQRMTTFNAMDRLLDRFETGKLAGIKKTIRGYASALGIPIDIEGLSASEAFNALAQQLALQSRNQGKGMVLAGQMSDKDVQFLKDMNPQLLNSKEGNRLIIKMKLAIERRNIEVARLAADFQEESGGVFDSMRFQKYLDEKLPNKSIFGIPEDAEFAGYDKQTGLPMYVKDNKGYIPKF